jgi:hypothetical protein
MAIDALLAVQASVTKTAAFSGAALILPGGTPFRGDKIRVLYSAASVASSTGTAVFGVDISYDAGSTWNTDFQAPALALTTTAQAGELIIPFTVKPTSVVNGIQIRLSLESITGTTATVTYQGDFLEN